MITIALTSDTPYGKNGETVEVEDEVALDLLSRGAANNVLKSAWNPKTKREYVVDHDNHVEPEESKKQKHKKP